MYDAGAGPFFDAANAHPYVFPGGLAADSKNGWSDVGRMRDVMVAHGDAGKKIWMTEIGAPTSTGTDGVSPQEQAKQITDVMAAAAARGSAAGVHLQNPRHQQRRRCKRERNFGALMTSDWQPKYTAGVLAR